MKKITCINFNENEQTKMFGCDSVNQNLYELEGYYLSILDISTFRALNTILKYSRDWVIDVSCHFSNVSAISHDHKI